MTAIIDQTGFAVAGPVTESRGSAPVHESIIERLRARAGYADPWHIALLRAVGEWNLPDEELAGRHWHYIIGGEALDWLTLAQRLCLAIPDAAPQRELEALLFRGQLPRDVGPERFRELIGPYRYTAHLNFWYGVVVEEALQLVTEDAIRKSRLARCYGDSDDVVEEAYRHLYGESRSQLAPQFLTAAGERWGSDPEGLSLAAWQELTYWLFKRRIRKWHPARIASDTRRGLDRLHELRGDGQEGGGHLFVPNEVALPALTAGRRG